MPKPQHAGENGPVVTTAAWPASQADVLGAHRRAGRRFQAAGVNSFGREQGSGPAVLCLHGMIGSSFLYSKVLDELAARGMRGMAFDLPGFGWPTAQLATTTAGPAWDGSALLRSTNST